MAAGLREAIGFPDHPSKAAQVLRAPPRRHVENAVLLSLAEGQRKGRAHATLSPHQLPAFLSRRAAIMFMRRLGKRKSPGANRRWSLAALPPVQPSGMEVDRRLQATRACRRELTFPGTWPLARAQLSCVPPTPSAATPEVPWLEPARAALHYGRTQDSWAGTNFAMRSNVSSRPQARVTCQSGISFHA